MPDTSYRWNEGFDEKLKRKYDIMQQKADAETSTQLAQAGYYGGINQTHENVAGRNSLAIAPYYNAMTEHQKGLTDELGFKLGIAKETRPSIIAQNLATMGLNTATNQAELESKSADQYNKWKGTNLAKPEWTNTPYVPATLGNTDTSPVRNLTFLPALYDWITGKSALKSMEENKVTNLNKAYTGTNNSSVNFTPSWFNNQQLAQPSQLSAPTLSPTSLAIPSARTGGMSSDKFYAADGIKFKKINGVDTISDY